MAARRKAPEVITDVDRALDRLQNETELALDLETGGLNPWRDPLAVVSLYGPKSNVAAIIHTRGYVPDRLRHFLGEEHRKILTHNGVGFDYLFLAANDVDILKPQLYDTMPVESALLSNGRNNMGVSLLATAKRRLGVELDKSLQKSGWMNDVLTPEQVAYCVGDITYLTRIRDAQVKAAKDDPQRQLASALETSIIKPVLQMEVNGMPISLSELSKYISSMGDRIEQAERQLREWFGDVNLRSVPQLKAAFKLKFGAELESTDKEHLAFVRDFGGPAGQAAAVLLEYKYAMRRVTVYDADWVSNYVYKGRVHCRYWQCGTETGRFSSSEPNMQQIPRDMRAVFGRIDDDHKFVKGDYSQIEVRIIAAYAQDSAMLTALDAEDIHRSMAADILDRAPADVTDDERKLAKALSFNLLFGGGVGKLYRYARQQGSHITEAEAKALVRRFFARYEGVAALKAQAYAVTSSGRAVIELPGGLKRLIVGPKCIGTTWLDTLAQGTAAAGLKFALRETEMAGISKYAVETVHDEIGGIVPADEAEDYKKELEQCMLRGMAKVTSAPLAVEMSVTDSWAK